MIWRRLLVRSDSTISDLHYTIQIAIGWSDLHLNRFHIQGKDYGVYHDGGISFDDNPERVLLSAFGFRLRERFLYEYDFGDAWLYDVRIEKRLPLEPKQIYPLCIDGKHAAPPEDCGGSWAYMRMQKNVSPGNSFATTGSMTISMMNGRKRISRLPRMLSHAEKSMPGCGNTQKGTVIGCFHIERPPREFLFSEAIFAKDQQCPKNSSRWHLKSSRPGCL